MAFTIKQRPRSGRPMVAEYLCQVHGRFAIEVARDELGDPPGEMPCATVMEFHIACRQHERAHRPCGFPSPHVISAPRGTRVRKVEVQRGGYQKPERETWTDTTNLGEGQDLDDWIADRDKVWERDRQREIKELIDG